MKNEYGIVGVAHIGLLVSDTSDQTNAWFVGYAKKDGYKDIAIAVVVENRPSARSGVSRPDAPE